MTVRTVPVTIEIPASRWFALAGLAERRQMTVADLLLERAMYSPAGRPRNARGTADHVLRLHGLGRTDRQIALELHISKATVRHHRARLGLPINPAR